MIIILDGLKPIEEIQVGDKVLAYDEETGEQDYKKVVQLFRNKTKEWYHIYVNEEEIVCTGGHPFYVVGKGFICARDLEVCDTLLQSDNKRAIIYAIEVEQLNKTETTYNFEVEDFHTYYVTESKILVHNSCKVSELDKNAIDQSQVEPTDSKYGTYDITYSDGSHYIGKGGKGRMWQSAAEHTTENAKVTAVKWSAAASDKAAFIQEAKWMNAYGWRGKNARGILLNLINSPGHKLL